MCPQVADGGAVSDGDKDFVFVLDDLDISPGLCGKECTPVGGDRGQAARPPALRDRREVVSSHLGPITAQPFRAELLFDETKGRIDSRIEIRSADWL